MNMARTCLNESVLAIVCKERRYQMSDSVYRKKDIERVSVNT